MDDQLKQSALDSHEFSVPGKIQASPTKPLATQHGLVLAYSPGVIAPRLEIEKDSLEAYKYTARGNLVAVISNDAAVLGLGNIDALAGKSVVEGKGVLFKKFAGVDVFDTEVDELDLDKFIEIVATLEPTFNGINLENIRAPRCFCIEQKLHEWMNILVFHDDQHGTAIINTAAILSGLCVTEKNISDMRVVVSSAGAVAIACMNLLITLGLQKHNIVVRDSKDVIYQGHEPNTAETKAAYAVADNGKHTLDDMIKGADIFPGCSSPKALTQEIVKKMAHALMILALTNPKPEILPPLTKEVRPNVIICTDHSDYPSQVNSALCFPFIFRSTLDVDAIAINKEMELAAVRVVAELIHAGQNEVMISAYGDQGLSFGPGYTIPKPSDPRLIVKIAPVVVKAAMKSGVATRPIADLDVYIDKLTELVYKTNLFMKPILSQARKAPKHVTLPEGEEARVLHTTQELVTLELAEPILVGHPNVVEMRIQRLGLQIKAGADLEIVNNESDPRFKEYQTGYSQITRCRSVTQEQAQRAPISNPTVIGAIMTQHGEADAMICGTVSDYHKYFSMVKNVFGYRDGAHAAGVMNVLLLPSGSIFITDTYINDEPGAEELAEIILTAAETIRRFDTEPRVVLSSYSSFGSSNCPSPSKTRQVPELVRERVSELTIDGEIHGDTALVGTIRNDCMPDSSLKGSANILVMLNMEIVRISYNLLCVSSPEGITAGPVLTGVVKPVHVLTPVASVRHVVNMVALAAIEAQIQSP